MLLTRQDLDPRSPRHVASSVRELLSLHDEPFVRCAYSTILGRDPEPEGYSHFLGRIRNGDDKRAILAAIRLSPEGRQRKIVLPGLDRAIRSYRWRNWPLLGQLLRLSDGERVDVRRQIAGIEAHLDRLSSQKQISSRVTEPIQQQICADEAQIQSSMIDKLSGVPEHNLAETLPEQRGADELVNDESMTAEPSWPRVGWITTWNVKCGIATHAEHLVAALPKDEYIVFAARQGPLIRPDEPNCLRSWNIGKDSNGFEEIARELRPRSVGAVVIQFNYGFFNHFELNDFIESLVAQGIAVVVDLHSTVDPFGDVENFRLTDFLGALRKCNLILAHSMADLDRLKALGLVKNVTLFPHGVVNRGHGLAAQVKQGNPPIVASFGFFLPNKGLPELVEAVSLLKQEGNPVHLLMVNSEHPDPESAREIQKVRYVIEQQGLEDEVEMHTEFLADDDCLALLEKADIVVNPYQRTGESASGSARYGLTAGRPVAVTPLAIFDDLDDAVFRLPGTTPNHIAAGVNSILKHIKEGTETAKRVNLAARQWIEEHDYSRQAINLMRTARSLARSKRVARGVFINTAKENCSIHESGRMVYNCINESDQYTLDYFSIGTFDASVLASEGRIELIDRSHVSALKPYADYDFWVFNWHFITMAPHLSLESIASLPGLKFSIILELEPGNPLKLIPSDVFDGYIALDPTINSVGKIFSFPRPLEGDPRPARSPREIPVIGSFGFGTPGKGFELLVEAVNREFDKAIVRINIPKGAYTSSTDIIHRQGYTKYIEALCKRIAKPGIEVCFTEEFMSPEELIEWCAGNDLNCFLYTRRQAGLSATTDQAIMSGRPLLTGSNDTFRHIHRYIPPYPVIGLREAIEMSVPLVQRIQQDWSHTSFSKTFERMLATFGISSLNTNDGVRELSARNDQRQAVWVVSGGSSCSDDIFCYSARIADCLRRSDIYEVRHVSYRDVIDLDIQATKSRPDFVILVDFASAKKQFLDKALSLAAGSTMLFADNAELADVRLVSKANELFVFPRLPIIPFYTPSVIAPMVPPRIILVGFAAKKSNLEVVVAKIFLDVPDAHVCLEVPAIDKAEFEIRVSGLCKRIGKANKQQLIVDSFPKGGDNIILSFIESRLIIFYNDLDRSEELLNVSSLAMTTERPVVFTRAGPFQHFLNGGTYFEDFTVSDAMSLGMAAQIKLYLEFGEWQCFAKLHRHFSRSTRTGQIIN